MHSTERIIAVHKDSLSKGSPDRRGELIARWEQSRSGNSPHPATELALRCVAGGNVNERELAFYVLMDVALVEPSLRYHISQLTAHRSASVRRELAFHLSRQFPAEFKSEIYGALLRDKATSVRVRTIRTIGMREFKAMLPELRTLRSSERNSKVIESLDYWIPLLEVGYRVDPSSTPGMLTVTALTGHGTASTNVKTTDPQDPLIRRVVAELRSRPELISSSLLSYPDREPSPHSAPECAGQARPADRQQ